MATTSPSDIEFLRMQKLGLMKTFSPSEICNVDDPPEECATQFDHDFYRCMWYSRTDIITDGTIVDAVLPDKTIVKRASYKIDHINHDILSRAQIICNFQSARVKDKYRKDSQDAMIAWTPNPLINFIINVELKAGDTTVIDPFDNIWLMQHIMWNTKPGELDIINDSIGNRPVMLNWSDNIPAQTCYYDLPFGYTYSSGSALPLYLFNSEISLHKVVTYHRNPIEKLLMMKITDDGTNWTYVPAALEMLEVSEFLPPTIEMSYHKLLPEEKETNKELDSIVIPMHTVLPFTGTNKMVLGKGDNIPITTLHPLLGVFTVARNLESEKINRRSNFTTSINGDGDYPITQFNMYYDTVLKFSKTSDSMRSNRMLAHYNNVPLVKGYLTYPYATRPFDTRYMVGPTLHPEFKASLLNQYGELVKAESSSSSSYDDADGTGLIRKLLAKSKAPVLVEKSQDVKYDSSEYQTEVRALVFRDLIFTKGPNGVRLFTMN
jgi:hypothetical protein